MVKIQTVIMLAVLMCVFNNSGFAESYPVRLGATVKLSSGIVVRADIVTVAFSSTSPKILAKRWGADDSPKLEPPIRIVSSMTVYLGEKQLILPLSAFSDLCEPRLLSIKATKRGFEINIKGSDAGGSYEARLYFEGTHLQRRKVVSSETPDNAWEETIYHSQFPENW